MRDRRVLGYAVGLTWILSLLTGCRASAPPTPTAVPFHPRFIEHKQPGLTISFDPIADAGCVLDGEFRSWLRCPPDSPVGASGCGVITRPTDLLGGLQPSYPIAQCEVERDVPSPVHRHGIGYVILQDDQFILIKTFIDLRQTYAPIETANEALSYVLAARLFSDSPSNVYGSPYYGLDRVGADEYFVDLIEDTHVESKDDGYTVQLYSGVPEGSDGTRFRAVDFHVTPQGDIAEVREEEAFAIRVHVIGASTWHGEAKAWIDENRNGSWDNGEEPLADVPFWTLRGMGTRSGISNELGVAQLSDYCEYDAAGPGSPESLSRMPVSVYAEAPPGYVHTTPKLVSEKPFLFGFAYPPDLPTPTPRPRGSLDCRVVESLYNYRLSPPTGGHIRDWGIKFAPSNSAWLLNRGFLGPGLIGRYSPAGEPLTAPDSCPDECWIGAIAFVDDERYWIGNSNTSEGVYHCNGKEWLEYTADDGLISNKVHDIAITENGDIWFATDKGISRYRSDTEAWENYPSAAWEFVRILLAPDGAIWLLQGDYVAAGGLGAMKRLAPAENGDGPYEQQIVAETASPEGCVDAAFDSVGDLWVTDSRQLSRLDTGQMSWTHYSSKITDGAMPPVGIGSMAVAPDGSVWLGTNGNGALQLIPGADGADDQWVSYQDDILSTHDLVHVAIDGTGNIWWVTVRDDGKSEVILCTGATPGE